MRKDESRESFNANDQRQEANIACYRNKIAAIDIEVLDGVSQKPPEKPINKQLLIGKDNRSILQAFIIGWRRFMILARY